MVAGRAVIMHILCVRACRWRRLQLSMPWRARAFYICATYAPICSYVSAYSTHTSQTNALKHMHTGWSLFDAISLMRPWQAETTLASNYKGCFFCIITIYYCLMNDKRSILYKPPSLYAARISFSKGIFRVYLTL